MSAQRIVFRLNYVGRRWRTWYIIAVSTAASIYFDNLLAGIFVALATIDIETTP